MTPTARTALDADLSTLTAFLTPERWTSHAAARDVDGVACPSIDADAARWCVDGAWTRLAHLGRIRGDDAVDTLVHQRARHRFGCSAQDVNDRYGYDAVIALLHSVTEEEAQQ